MPKGKRLEFFEFFIRDISLTEQTVPKIGRKIMFSAGKRNRMVANVLKNLKITIENLEFRYGFYSEQIVPI